MRIVAAKKLLKANDQLAAELRQRFLRSGVFCVNVVGSPGAGKTTMIEGLLRQLGPAVRPAVIEGDIAGSIDADRLDQQGVPVVQINTEGACHLDAGMIGAALEQLDLEAIDLLLMENVGNLVCTAGFDLGEQLRVVVLSTVEGDDKAVKYPAIFQGAQALLITKADLMGHTNFDRQRIAADYRRLAPEGEVFEIAALNGEGLPELAAWLSEQATRGAAPS